MWGWDFNWYTPEENGVIFQFSFGTNWSSDSPNTRDRRAVRRDNYNEKRDLKYGDEGYKNPLTTSRFNINFIHDKKQLRKDKNERNQKRRDEYHKIKDKKTREKNDVESGKRKPKWTKSEKKWKGHNKANKNRKKNT